MRKTNPAIPDDEVAKIVSEVDLDGDGTINFDGKQQPREAQPGRGPGALAGPADHRGRRKSNDADH